jgi:hypothetical protein
MWLNFVHKSTIQLLLWHPRRWKTHGVNLSTVWTFCELQMTLTLRSIELDMLFFQVDETSSVVSPIFCVLCVLVM